MKAPLPFLLALLLAAQLCAAETKIIAPGAELQKLAGDFAFTESVLWSGG